MTIEPSLYPNITPNFQTDNSAYKALCDNVLYDVVMAVRSMDGPNYKDVRKSLNGKYYDDTIVSFLHYAEKHGYIIGKNGYYSKYGGGAKQWYICAPETAPGLPSYPYEWLDICARHPGGVLEYLVNAGCYLIKHIRLDRAVNVYPDYATAIKKYKWMFKETLHRDVKLSDDFNNMPRPHYQIVGKDGISAPIPLSFDWWTDTIYWDVPIISASGHVCQKIPDCLVCSHFIGEYTRGDVGRHLVNLGKCREDKRPLLSRTYARRCPNYDPYDEQGAE